MGKVFPGGLFHYVSNSCKLSYAEMFVLCKRFYLLRNKIQMEKQKKGETSSSLPRSHYPLSYEISVGESISK